MSDLVVSIPEPRLAESMVPTLATLVIRHAKRIMERLGARAPDDQTLGSLSG